MLISMHLILLADVNKYVGVGIGGGILLLNGIFAFIFKKKIIQLYVLVVNAVGCGLAISSLYVHCGYTPQIWQSAAIWAAFSVLFVIYCLIVNVETIKYHPVISLIVYILLLLVPLIICAALLNNFPFSLALLAFVPFASFLITTALRAKNVKEHLFNIACSSFVALVIVIIVVLIVISEGEIADGLDFPIGGDGGSLKKKHNPYDFITTYDAGIPY